MASDPLTLSVVDQSPMRRGGTAAEALAETVRLAQIAEELGYQRYWVAEHHNAGSFAGTSPEILIGQIAAHTRTIRVGSGGVMLPHYSAFKVAEQFSVLDAFFPGRIDLGLGRAPGSDQMTAAALAYPRAQVDIREFPQMVADVVGYLAGTIGGEHPFARLRIRPGPQPATRPRVWLLGSSDYSARLAALLGLPFAFADFFGYTGAHGPAVADLYRREFTSSGIIDEPQVNVALHVLCAPTTSEAIFLGSSRNLNRAAHVLGLNGLLPPEEAVNYPLSDDLRDYVRQSTLQCIDAAPEEARTRIEEAAERYGTRDVSIVTTGFSFEHRVRSYRLLADVFDLTPRASEPAARPG